MSRKPNYFACKIIIKIKKIHGLWNQFPKVNDDSNFIINYKILKPFFNLIACPELSEKSQLINNFGKNFETLKL